MPQSSPLRRRLAAMGAAALALGLPAAAHATDPATAEANAAICSVVPPHTALTQPQQYLEQLRGQVSKSALGAALIALSDKAQLPICVASGAGYHWDARTPVVDPKSPGALDVIMVPHMLTTGILDQAVNLAAPGRKVEDSLLIGRVAQATATINTAIVLYQLRAEQPQAALGFFAGQQGLAKILDDAKPEELAGIGASGLRSRMFEALISDDAWVKGADISTLRILVTRLGEHNPKLPLDAVRVPAEQVANLAGPWGDFLKDTKLADARYSAVRGDDVKLAVEDYRKLLKKLDAKQKHEVIAMASAPAARMG